MRDRLRVGRLRVWRLREGLTLDEVAGLSGLSVPMLSRVERGQRNLRPLTKVRLARSLGVSVSDLFDAESGDAESA